MMAISAASGGMADHGREEYYNTGVFRLKDGAWQAVTWHATKAHKSSSCGWDTRAQNDNPLIRRG